MAAHEMDASEKTKHVLIKITFNLLLSQPSRIKTVKGSKQRIKTERDTQKSERKKTDLMKTKMIADTT